MTQNKKLTTIMALLLILLLTACGSGEQATTEASDQLALDDFVPVISATGVVKPNRWVTLSFPSGGLVRELLVERGETVETGQVLGRLSSIEQARSAVTAARLEYIQAEQALDLDWNDSADPVRQSTAESALPVLPDP